MLANLPSRFTCYSLDKFFYLENESFCLCSMPKGLHFMSLGGATSPNKKRRKWVIGHNTVSMHVGFYSSSKVLAICSWQGEQIYLDITKWFTYQRSSSWDQKQDSSILKRVLNLFVLFIDGLDILIEVLIEMIFIIFLHV